MRMRHISSRWRSLKTRPLDQDANLPIALGAAIEVRGRTFSPRETSAPKRSPICGSSSRPTTRPRSATRIQKNINLLSDGRASPRRALGEVLHCPRASRCCCSSGRTGAAIANTRLRSWRGLKSEFGPKGLAIVAPTQKYGYVAGGEDAPPEVELRYIEQVRAAVLRADHPTPAPVSEENFRRYGASTTPTLVLVDRAGIVTMYHPGAMTYEDSASADRSVVSLIRRRPAEAGPAD